VRAEARVNGLAAERHHLEIVDVEPAVTDGHVDAVGDRLPDAGDDLPREARVGIVEERCGVGEDALVVRLDAGDAGAGADEAGNSVVIAEVEHAVDHEAESAARAAGEITPRRESRAFAGKADAGLEAVEVSLLVGHLRFQPERTQVVADEQGAVIAIFMIENELGVPGLHRSAGWKKDLRVFDDHRTEIATNVPGAIARKGWSCEQGG
jgi:hypothetical protein